MKEWQFWTGLFLAIAGACCCMAGIFIRISRKTLLQDKANCCLCIGVFALIWHLFIYCLIYTAKITSFPYLYNKGIPLYYLAAPCFYFYTRFTLFPTGSFSRYACLHLIPFLFGLIDIMPYALASAADQHALLRLLVSDLQTGFRHSYGFIDQQWHYIVRFSLAIIYVIAQWNLLYNFDDFEDDKRIQYKRKATIFTAIYSGYLLFQCSMVLAIVLNRQQGSFILRDTNNLIVVSFFFFMFSIWFIRNSVKTFLSTRL